MPGGPFDLNGNLIRDTYHRVVQYESSSDQLLDGRGDQFNRLAITSSINIQGDFIIDGNILPRTHRGSNIGEISMSFGDIYARDLYLDSSSLYVDGVKVIDSTGSTININSDPGQDLRVRTSGSGDLRLESENEINFTANGGLETLIPSASPTKHINFTNQSVGGNITFTAQGTNGEVQFYGNDEISFNAPDVEISGAVRLQGLGINNTSNEFVVFDGDDLKKRNISSLGLWTGSATYISRNSDVHVSGNLYITEKVFAEEYHTEIVSSSIVYTSGSTKFGDSQDDKHEFTGSIFISDNIGSDSIHINNVYMGGILKANTGLSIQTETGAITLTAGGDNIFISDNFMCTAGVPKTLGSTQYPWQSIHVIDLIRAASDIVFQSTGSIILYPSGGESVISSSLYVSGNIELISSATVDGVDISEFSSSVSTDSSSFSSRITTNENDIQNITSSFWTGSGEKIIRNSEVEISGNLLHTNGYIGFAGSSVQGSTTNIGISPGSSVVGGSYNSIICSQGSNISSLGGVFVYNSIFGGQANTISGSGVMLSNTIVGGNLNKIFMSGNGVYNGIFCGSDNTMGTGVGRGVIIGGQSNIIDNTNNECVIVGGRYNNILLTTMSGSVILGGIGNTSSHRNQVVLGQYNETGSEVFIIGGGLDDSNRKNIFAVSENGDTFISGTLSVENGYFQGVHNSEVDVNIITPVAIDWETQDIVDSIYGHSTSESSSILQISQSGWFDVSYNLCHDYSGTGSDAVIQTVLRKNGSDNILKTLSLCNKSANTGDNSNTWNGLLFLSSSEYIELMASNAGGDSIPTASLYESSSLITIKFIRS